MNAKRRRHFARRLEAERRRVAEVLHELESEAAIDVIEAAPNRDRSREAFSDAEVAEAEASLEIAQLREIDAALRRLREHPEEFGKCIVCAEEIENERLELVPWTRRCVGHAAERTAAKGNPASGDSVAPILE